MATATAPAITSRTQYEILRLFADGKSEIEIADFTTLTPRAVSKVVNEMCAGDQDTARELATAYERRASLVAAAQGKPGVPGVPRVTTVPPPGTLRPPAPAPGPPAMARATDVLADLLAAAQVSPHQRTRSLGAKVAALAEDLRTRLTEERREAAAAEAAARARAEAERQVKELEARLAKARAALLAAGGKPARAAAAGKTTSEIPAKVVRAWARENDIEVPPLGRIPGPVMDAYLAAHPGTPKDEGK
ncbi:histone-like nucleoid-structuring protein Lsr2 [Micromonospora sp. NPDC048063]|uniref:Lsr2 family DNA-binding protein n=1 Tax=Micromonospora sp. NPDC048063 TaxID=3364256 RepID=UPI003713232E